MTRPKLKPGRHSELNGKSSTVKMLMIVRWALLRGGRWTPKELMHRFGVNKSTAYRYHEEWREVFGDGTPRHLNRPPAQADIKAMDDAAITHLNEAPADNQAAAPDQPPNRVSLSSLLGDPQS